MRVGYASGALLEEHGLWLDPRRGRERAFVSHAHWDHVGRHGWTLCSHGTARLMAARLAGREGKAGAAAAEVEGLDFGERRRLGDLEVELRPAGHVLGSAMLWGRDARGSVLYTGDFKLRRGLASEACEPVVADTLVMETTFGLPRYAMPPAGEVLARIAAFCGNALEDGAQPVLLGYSLGKAQELMCALAAAGFRLAAHPTAGKVAEVYRELGMAMPEHIVWAKGADLSGRVLICPPGAARGRALAAIARKRTAAVTGWALDPGAKYRWGCDEAFPLTDHADYPDLLRMVELVRPRRVFTLHGFAGAFAADLRARGVEAWALSEENQLEMPFVGALDGKARLASGLEGLRARGLQGGERGL